MKNLFKSTMLVAIIASAFAGCSKDATSDIENVISANTVTVNFGASVEETRATLTPNDDETAFAAAWEETDQIGVRIFSNTQNNEIVSNHIGKWTDNAFAAQLSEGNGEYTYNAYYPYAENEMIKFGSERVQYGNKYNSQYDIMISETVIANGEIGKDEGGKPIVFPMKRQTAIAYFHFTTTDENIAKDKLMSATLTVNAEAVIAAESVMPAYYGDMSTPYITDGDSNVIKITFDPDTAPAAADFTACFNVLPCSFDSMTLELETENYKATVTRNSAGTYEMGKLYKVSGKLTKWESKVVPNGTVLWSEDWSGYSDTDTQPKTANTVYNNGTVQYNYSTTSTKIYKENHARGTSPELLLAKNSGKWTIKNIPTGNCKSAILTFISNKSEEKYYMVSSDTDGVTVNYDNNGEISYIVSFENVANFNLTFTNNTSDNTRIDNIKLVVGEKLPKADKPVLEISDKNDTDGYFTATWKPATGASKYAWRLTAKDDSSTDLQTDETTATTITINGLDVTKQYVLYVKSVGDGTTYMDSDEASTTVSFGGTAQPEPVTETFNLGDYPDFNNWKNTYDKHILNYTNADIVFNGASKQTGTITDCPVTKGNDIEVKMKNNAILKGVNIILKQWGSKTQTATLHYSIDGGSTYQTTNISSKTFVLKNEVLPDGTNAVKVTFSSKSNQVGCKSVEITYVK